VSQTKFSSRKTEVFPFRRVSANGESFATELIEEDGYSFQFFYGRTKDKQNMKRLVDFSRLIKKKNVKQGFFERLGAALNK
jgi:hypothetical protein